MARLLPLPADAPNRPKAIWRYLSISRFIWLLERKALWFARGDLLGDRWEGMPNKAQVTAALTSWEADVANGKTTPYANRDEARAGLARVVLYVPMNSYVNCWTFRTAE